MILLTFHLKIPGRAHLLLHYIKIGNDFINISFKNFFFQHFRHHEPHRGQPRRRRRDGLHHRRKPHQGEHRSVDKVQ
jgi:hypothetical protein